MHRIKNKLKGLLSVGALAILQGIGLAQDVVIRSSEEAIALALSQNLDYQNYVLNQEQADLDYRQARNFRLPNISATVSGQRNLDLATTPLPGEIFGQPEQTVETQFGQNYNYNAGFNVGLQLINRESQLQAQFSKLSIDQANVEKRIFEDLLKEQTNLYYFTALIAKRAVDLGLEDLRSAQDISSISQQRFDEGLIDAIVRNTALINENKVKQNLNANRQLQKQCEMELRKLFGMAPTDKIVLADDSDLEVPPSVGLDQLVADPVIESARLSVEQSGVQLKASRSALLPTLSVNSYFGKQQFRDDFGVGFGSNDWTNYSYVSLNLSMPIFAGFSNRNRIKKSQVSQQIALNERRKAEYTATHNDELILSDYLLSQADAQSAYENYKLYEENADLTLKKYDEGIIGLDSYLSVFEDYLRAENTYLNALSKAYTNYSQVLPRIQR